MMKNALVAVFFILPFLSQAQSTFRINYDLALFDLPIVSTEALSNGNYVFSGFHTNFLPIRSSITQIDGNGAVTWANYYSTGGLATIFGDLKADPVLNRYMVCGGADNGPAFLMFLNGTGGYISGRTFSISQASGAYFNRMIKASDGGYVCVGYVTGHNPGGGETHFTPVTHNPPECSGSTTEIISSPLIVKFDASGNVLWHRVFRYYISSVAPANRIYNDASFVDVVEVNDGYVAIGNYDVNNVFSVYDTDGSSNSCGDDRTPTDAMFLKVTTAGAITWHRQIDNPSSSTSQSSKYLESMSKTAGNQPIICGSDNSGGTTRPAIFFRLPNSGSWSVEWSRRYAGDIMFPFIGPYWPFIPSRIFPTADGQYGVWLSYIPGLSWRNVLMKINPATNGITFAKQHSFNFATILPHGHQVSDNGYIGLAYNLAGTGHDMHFIKTDANGDGPTTCAASNLSVSNGSGPSTFGTPLYNSWDNGTVTNGTFTPTITAINPGVSIQCIQTVCVPPPAPTLSASPSTTICAGQSVSITASGSGTGVTYRFFTVATGGTPFSTANPTSVSPSTTTTYYVEAEDNSNPGCVSTRTSITITVNPVPNATAGSNSPLCAGSTINLTSSGGGTYSWSGPNSFSNSNQNPSIPNASVANAGTYTVTVTASGCTASASTVVTVNSPPNPVASGNSPVCTGQTISLTASGGNSYSWSGPNSFSSSAQNPTIPNATSAMHGAYTVTVTAANGCTASTVVLITVNTSPTASAGSNSPVCQGLTISLNSSGGGTYSWSGPGGFSSGSQNPTIPNASAGNAGSYTVTVTAANNCTATASTSVTVNPLPSASASSNSPVCVGQTLQLNASGGTSYAWSGPNGFTSNAQNPTIANFQGLNAGTYTVTVTAGGCSATTTVFATLQSPTGPAGIWTWEGTLSQDWFDPCNWDKKSLPAITNDVVIPGPTPWQPWIVGDTAYCSHIEIYESNGALLTIDFDNGGFLLKQP